LREQAKTIKALKAERDHWQLRQPVPSVDVRSFASFTLFFDLNWCL